MVVAQGANSIYSPLIEETAADRKVKLNFTQEPSPGRNEERKFSVLCALGEYFKCGMIRV